MKITATAKVQLTVSITELGCWGSDCGIDQLYRQAKKSAEQKLFAALKQSGIIIVGEPKVFGIITEDKL